MANTKGSKKGITGIKIDKEQFERLCSILCSADEISGFFGVSYATLLRWCKHEYGGLAFEEVWKSKASVGKISLRRIQFKQAERYPAMSIFLGKQYLGQSDNAHADNLIDGLTSKAQEIVVKIRNKANEDDDEQ